jgi:hypothetical protein
MVRSFREYHLAIQRVAVEGFGAGELLKVFFAKCFGRHDCLSLSSDPQGGGESGNRQPRKGAASQATWNK